jgi:hypothetical protein
MEVRMLIRILAGVGLFCAASVASAGFIDGQMLKEMLNARSRVDQGNFRSTDFQAASRASGYVMGVVDAVESIMICPGAGITAGQLTAMVAKYLEENPDKWSQSGDQIVVNALRPTFPCQRD